MNQKFPEAPEKKQVKKPPNAGDRSTTGEGSARTGDIPTAPQLRRRAESLAEEERRAGIATVLFSLTVAAAALFVCLLVGVLTVRSALPSRGNSKPGVTTDGNGSGNSVTPTDPGARPVHPRSGCPAEWRWNCQKHFRHFLELCSPGGRIHRTDPGGEECGGGV